jgi:hypothetical protein
MRISRAGIFVLIAFSILVGTGCGRILARKDLVDGAEAYKNKKFDEAEARFRSAISRAEGSPEEKTAQLFLARTLHSQYAADRTKTDKAEAAITEYKKTIEGYKKTVSESKGALTAEGRSPCSYSTYETRRMEGDRKAAFDSFAILRDSLGAVANLLDSLQRPDERVQWLTQWAEDTNIPECLRASAYNSLAARENTCANDITEDPVVKKTEKEGDKQIFVFKKPEDPARLEQLRQCIQRGTDLVNKALELDPESDSIWSYKTSFLIQSGRLAEMEGNTAERDRFRAESDAAKAKFTELAKKKKEKADAEEAATKAEEEEKQNTR